ncbi:transmembrane protein, putative [Medicago truncatula]|uniref:Transmembrane protein, putative n=1 Tax=Medicago truncatula TaxID=3880 RepID=A0A072TR25_MEDTR|nr:transmembrane protein, putative [Medicago truncatula]
MARFLIDPQCFRFSCSFMKQIVSVIGYRLAVVFCMSISLNLLLHQQPCQFSPSANFKILTELELFFGIKILFYLLRNVERLVECYFSKLIDIIVTLPLKWTVSV